MTLRERGNFTWVGLGTAPLRVHIDQDIRSRKNHTNRKGSYTKSSVNSMCRGPDMEKS